MSRSYRHSPIKSYGSNRWNKQKYNRRYRRKTKVITQLQYYREECRDPVVIFPNRVYTCRWFVLDYQPFEYPPPVKDQEWHIREKKCWFGFHSWNWHPVEPEHQLRYK